MKRFHFILIILFFIIILRIPYLFEPHWYFDESIYLTVSQALHRGEILYRDIYDLKPPLIYFTYFLAQSHLLWMRLLTTLSVLLTSIFIYKLSKNLLAMIIFGFLGSITLFEGGIANTEVFMILLTSLGFLILQRTERDSLYILAGFSLGLAFLYKIVAIFDFMALIFFTVFLLKLTVNSFKKISLMVLTFLIPLLVVSTYFYINHGLFQFVSSVFLYNTSYIDSKYLLFKVGAFCLGLATLTMYRRKFSNFEIMVYLWFVFSLFGALFGGRPYPHYFIQTIPSFSIIIALGITNKNLPKKLIAFFISVILFISFFLNGFYLYPIRSYYKNVAQFILQKESVEKFQSFFNPKLPEVYEAANFIKENSNSSDNIYTLSDYPQLYELTNRRPAAKFIVASHLNLIPGSKKEVLNSLSSSPPKFIIVFSKDYKLDGLETILRNNYLVKKTIEDLTIYQSQQSLRFLSR